ncbi:MAG: hypothetical protein ACXWUE_24855 [Polyangiales bacterium]
MKLLRTAIVSSVLAISLIDATPSSAQILLDPGILLQPTWKCRRWDLRACTTADLASSSFRQVLVMPTGSAESDRAQFWTDFDTFVRQMSNTGTVWSTTYRDRVLYVGYFTGGSALGSGTAAFNGSILPGAVSGAALDVDPPAIDAKIADIKATTLPDLRPMAVGVLFNDTGSSPPSATPPNFNQRKYGIARFNRAHLSSPYAPMRGVTTAMFGFLSEAVTKGFEETSIRSLDVITPSLKLGPEWGSLASMTNPSGTYDYNLSELLAGNGNDNIALSSSPSTAPLSWYSTQTYDYEGGLSLGRGTWHSKGSNLLNDNVVMRGPDDGFAYAHSLSQQALIDTVFNGASQRPNDRLRTAGPKSGWPLALGSTTRVMIFDADKNHPTHPTQYYYVQVGWYQREWYTVWNGPVPVMTYRDVWTTVQKSVLAGQRTMVIDPNQTFGLANFAQQLLCGVGVTRPGYTGAFKVCAQRFSDVPAASLPSIALLSPYQETDLPSVTQWGTTYWWRVSAVSGTSTGSTIQSGWTGWSSFYRSL